MSSCKRLCSFQNEWLKRKEFCDWLKPVSNNKHRASCTLCRKSFDIGNMGSSALLSHTKSQHHLREMQQKADQQEAGTQQNLCMFNFNVTSSTSHTSSNNSASAVAQQLQVVEAQQMTNVDQMVVTNMPQEKLSTSTVGINSNQQGTVKSFTTKDDVSKAEVIWIMKTVMSHQSYNSAEGLNKVLQTMFPDSEIAKKMQLGPDKMAYIVKFGLAEYFRSILIEEAKMADCFVLAFDEALNKINQRGQMDVYIRFWDNKRSRVTSRYLNSAFLGHATADDLVDHFLASAKGVNMKRLVQVSMDGPRVNHSFFAKLKDKLASDPDDAIVLDIGTCGLHIVHGAFQTGAKASGFDINHLLTSLYYLFHDSPARREDYSTITKAEVFPKKFCAHRWVENGPVAERALEIWKHVQKYVRSVKKKPDTKSFDLIKSAAEDPLTVARLEFFLSVTAHVKHFLTVFQGDRPLLPFLGDELGNVVKSLMNRFIKKEVLADADTVLKLTKIDCDDKKNYRDYKQIDIGFAANKVLQEAPNTVSDLQKMTFRMGCCKFLAAMTSKLLERSPLKYGLVRNLNCLVPKNMATVPEDCRKAFNKVLETLLTKKHFRASQCDEAGRQFSKFCDQIVKVKSSEFSNFVEVANTGKEADRLDVFFSEYMETNADYADLWKVIKFCLILSHGQAFVESGFSINKDMIAENQLEDSLVARRIVYHGVKDAGLNVTIIYVLFACLIMSNVTVVYIILGSTVCDYFLFIINILISQSGPAAFVKQSHHFNTNNKRHVLLLFLSDVV